MNFYEGHENERGWGEQKPSLVPSPPFWGTPLAAHGKTAAPVAQLGHRSGGCRVRYPALLRRTAAVLLEEHLDHPQVGGRLEAAALPELRRALTHGLGGGRVGVDGAGERAE